MYNMIVYDTRDVHEIFMLCIIRWIMRA